MSGYLIILLDIQYLGKRLIPEKVERYSIGPGGEKLYDVAVLVVGGSYLPYRVPRDRSALSPPTCGRTGGSPSRTAPATEPTRAGRGMPTAVGR